MRYAFYETTALGVGAGILSSSLATYAIGALGLVAAPAAIVTGIGVEVGFLASVGINIVADKMKSNHYVR